MTDVHAYWIGIVTLYLCGLYYAQLLIRFLFILKNKILSLPATFTINLPAKSNSWLLNILFVIFLPYLAYYIIEISRSILSFPYPSYESFSIENIRVVEILTNFGFPLFLLVALVYFLFSVLTFYFYFFLISVSAKNKSKIKLNWHTILQKSFFFTGILFVLSIRYYLLDTIQTVWTVILTVYLYGFIKSKRK